MLKRQQKLGKYTIEARLGEGGFATVYRARDTIEGIKVALKVPHPELSSGRFLDDFRQEIRLTAPLDHPGILPIKNASVIGGRFVIALPLGETTLANRLQRRMAPKTALNYSEQILEAVAYAHRNKIVHCDLKPENFILFPENRIRLTDFGIAKLAWRRKVISGSGTGTVGYLAPEQAFGRPSYASDVFALGLLFYRMFAGQLPTWPYHWPPAGFDRLRRTVHPDFIAILRRATIVDHTRRYSDANRMLAAFQRVKPRALRGRTTMRRRRKNGNGKPVGHWRTLRLKEFNQGLGRALEAKHQCGRCHGPMSEAMRWCPWCGTERKRHTGKSSFPGRCKRCKRGVKLDWRFCPWCYGGIIQEPSSREYSDVRYDGRCRNSKCGRKDLMPFMRYCPWCRTKVARKWKLPESGKPCEKCGWGVATDYWSACPWCGTQVRSA
ncbi:MAG: serine/threonine-protein kinase [Gemmatimonadales bacterium]